MVPLYFVAVLIFAAPNSALWPCSNDAECYYDQFFCRTVVNSTLGVCSCPNGQQMADRNTRCVEAAMYYNSPCVESNQCSFLLTGFECGASGTCVCAEGFQYFQGRCWETTGDYGSPCTIDRNCYGNYDPYSLQCLNDVCTCAQGYYRRQRRECRSIGYDVGDGCILDDDCHFDGGACDRTTQTCVDAANREAVLATPNANSTGPHAVQTKRQAPTRVVGDSCSSDEDCSDVPNSVCSPHYTCSCPRGFYARNGICLSELGFSSTEEFCLGNFAKVIDGVCKCPNGFFYAPGGQDCLKATMQFGDSCTSNVSCYTFGAGGYCHDDEDTGFQYCLCDETVSVPDIAGNICMSTAYQGVGEQCADNSDCRTASLQEIDCVLNSEIDVSTCTCPETQVPSVENNLCLLSGLDFGSPCQMDAECGAANTVCRDGFCSCIEDYFHFDGVCNRALGAVCAEDSECIIASTKCDGTCQCVDNFVANGTLQCLPWATGIQQQCEEDVQCTAVLGEASGCTSSACVCLPGFHFRDGFCYPTVAIGSRCSRNGECFLGSQIERSECRNSVCECLWDLQYDRSTDTCSGASTLFVSAILPALLFAILTRKL